MNKLKCTNQHWFDADVYSVCPHCGAQRMTEEMVGEPESGDNPDNEEKSKKKVFFWRKSKIAEQDENITLGEKEMGASKNFSGGPSGRSTTHSASSYPEDALTKPAGVGEKRFPETEVLIPPASGKMSYSTQNMKKNDTTETQGMMTGTQKAENSTSKVPFTGTVLHTSGQSELINPGAEMMKQLFPKEIDEIKTVTIYANEQGEEPVTGWLVCVSGIYRGRSFPLKAGVNVIGRDENAFVCLKKDLQVSREKHASIIYEPKRKIFYLGEGQNSLTYCNDELICGKQEINAYDSIEIGGGKYLFIPLCGEKFDWDTEH